MTLHEWARVTLDSADSRLAKVAEDGLAVFAVLRLTQPARRVNCAGIVSDLSGTGIFLLDLFEGLEYSVVLDGEHHVIRF